MKTIYLFCLVLVVCIDVCFAGSGNLAAVFEQKEAQLRNLALSIKAAYDNRGTTPCKCSYYDCRVNKRDLDTCSLRHGTSSCTTVGRPVSSTKTFISQLTYNPAGQSEELKSQECWTREAEDALKANWNDNTITWTYLATPQGLFRGFPGLSTEECSGYDPRNKPWYIAATSGPKDVVLVIDVSGSMAAFSRLELAKRAAIQIISTLSVFDYFTVIVFSDTARVLGVSEFMLQATKANKDSVLLAINQLSPETLTNYEAAFTLAYKVLNQSIASERTSRCNKLILFLTDGDVTSGLSGTALMNKIQDLNRNIDATIFTYGLGSEVSQNFIKDLACNTNGIYAQIADGGNLVGQMGAYFNYIATLRPTIDFQNGLGPIVWSEPYQDESGAGDMTTAAVAIYDTTFDPPLLIAVAGIDVTVRTLLEINNDPSAVLFEIVTRSATCPRIQRTGTSFQCALEVLRARDYTTSTLQYSRMCSSSSRTLCANYETISTARRPPNGYLNDYCPGTVQYHPCCGNGCQLGQPCSGSAVVPAILAMGIILVALTIIRA